jgi:ankyrin repeat protein
MYVWYHAFANSNFKLLVQAADQHEVLVNGLDLTSALICRICVIEDLYRKQATPSLLDPRSRLAFEQKFEDNLIALYRTILEFQARAVLYLRKPLLYRTWNDMFKQDGWETLLQDMETSQTSLQRFTELINADELRTRLEDLQRKQESYLLWQKQTDREKHIGDVLSHLHTCPYKVRKDRNPERVAKTCEWFTAHPLFQGWLKKRTSSLLWISADPGCGKSVLAKYLVDHVVSSAGERSTCYFFFKDDFQDQKSSANALRAILRQLFLEKPHLLRDSILEQFRDNDNKPMESFNELWEILTGLAVDETAGEIVCILDALDECQDSDRVQLLQAINKFYTSNEPNCRLKFLVTSRPFDHIQREFRELEKQLLTIHLSGENEEEIEKISGEIDLVIRHRIEAIGRKRALEPDETSFMLSQFTHVKNRTYLWATLTLDVIDNSLDGITKGSIRRTISNIPRTVNQAYERILQRSTNPEKAKLVLQAVIAATRPLSLEEMAIILAIEGSHATCEDVMDELEPQSRFRGTVRDLCGLFVVVIDGKIYLLHQTAREFLVRDGPQTSLHNHSTLDLGTDQLGWMQSISPQRSHRVLAEKCIWHLILDSNGAQLPALFDYSALNWAGHFREAGVQADEATVELAEKLCGVRSSPTITWCLTYGMKNISLPYPGPPLTIASYFGLDVVVKRLLEAGADVNGKAEDGTTALIAAVLSGQVAAVEQLLKAGAHLNASGKRGFTALCQAAYSEHGAVAKMLLDEGADMSIRCNLGRTPVDWAVQILNSGAVKWLLKAGADASAMMPDGWTLLQTAAVNGDETTLKLLLEAGADLEGKGNRGTTPLDIAAREGNSLIVRLLLKAGAKVDAVNSYGITPLTTARAGGHDSVVKLLLAAGAKE